MDYEKKYNEALERAKYVLHTVETAGCAMHKDLLTEIFPELAESEDERIRKWLVDYFGSIKATVWIYRDITCEQILTWLEKQKEQPTDAKTERVIKAARRVLNNWLDGTDCPDVSGDFAELEYAIREYDGEEKQKEQKPVKKQDYSGLNDLERAILRGFLCAGVENVPVGIIKDTASECIGFLALIEPEKPAEWGEEDERIIESLISLIETISEYYIPSVETRNRYVAWLKSLRPSWKPSQEQMSALLWCIAHLGGADRRVLAELYEHLKMYCK